MNALLSLTSSCHRSLAVLAVIVVLGAGQASGQQAGIVLDDAGRPISGALVDAWSSTALIARAVTGDDGEFHFAGPAAQPARLLLVRAIGYAPTRVDLAGDAGARETVRMHPFSVDVAPLVESGGPACPIKDDPAARTVWQVIRQRYPLDEVRGLAIKSSGRYSQRDVTAPDFGSIDTSEAGWSQQGATSRAWAIWRAEIQQGGYARPNTGEGMMTGRVGGWLYPPLDGEYAIGFIDSVFGARHDFAFVGADHSLLQFCPKSGKTPGLNGQLVLTRDTALASAAWRVEGGGVKEVAGGYVLFGPITPSAPPLPLMGIQWRQTIPGHYVQVTREYRKWTVTPSTHLTPDEP